MAFVDDSLFDEEEQNDLSGDAGSPQVPGGGLGSAGTGSTNASASGETPGRFADLSEYLRVNDDQNFGSQLASKVGEDINQAQSTLGNVEQDFRGRVDANTVRDDAGLINQVQSAPQSIDQDQFARLRDAQYGGPSSLSETPDLYSQSQSASQTATSRANASKTEPGRFALLDNYFGRPNYTQGEKSLDNLLVQNDTDSQQAFNQMRENANQLAQNQQQMGQNLNTFAAQSKADTQGTRDAARGALGIDDDGNYIQGQGAIGAVRGDVQNTQEAQQAELDRIRQALESGNYGEIGEDVRGSVDQYMGTGDYNTGISNFIRLADDPTESSVASDEQAQRLAALTRLAGIDSPYGDQTGNFNPYEFNSSEYDQAVGARRNDFTLATEDLGKREASIQSAQSRLQELEAATANPSPSDISSGRWNQLATEREQIRQQLEQDQRDYQARVNVINEEFGQAYRSPFGVNPAPTNGNVIRSTF